MSVVTIIGRGHGGTRAMSHTLAASGVFMGTPQNRSGDLLPPFALYDACRVLARQVQWRGDLTWDWSALRGDMPKEFTDLVRVFLRSVLASDAAYRGWKLPETTLVFPWIARLFPEAKFIFWVRDPRDSVLAAHKTDDLRDFGIQYPPTDDVRLRRAISWYYQDQLVKATPKPDNWIQVRFEDFVLRQDETLERLSDYLGLRLAKIRVNKEAVGRWRTDTGVHTFDFLEPAMQEYGYE
ncbi:MAG: sulfotransferase [Anaerolineae bacterium]|nr:sulfotransferase [Anaerolineae bacterium]